MLRLTPEGGKKISPAYVNADASYCAMCVCVRVYTTASIRDAVQWRDAASQKGADVIAVTAGSRRGPPLARCSVPAEGGDRPLRQKRGCKGLKPSPRGGGGGYAQAEVETLDIVDGSMIFLSLDDAALYHRRTTMNVVCQLSFSQGRRGHIACNVHAASKWGRGLFCGNSQCRAAIGRCLKCATLL